MTPLLDLRLGRVIIGDEFFFIFSLVNAESCLVLATETSNLLQKIKTTHISFGKLNFIFSCNTSQKKSKTKKKGGEKI